MTMIEFLKARLNEDERQAVGYDSESHEGGKSWELCESPEYPTIYISHRRVLAEVKAKHTIIEEHEAWPDMDYEWVVWLITLPYADHPDYSEEWKP